LGAQLPCITILSPASGDKYEAQEQNEEEGAKISVHLSPVYFYREEAAKFQNNLRWATANESHNGRRGNNHSPMGKAPCELDRAQTSERLLY
jgi:hypothetical protein